MFKEQKENETIKERNITLKLSDDDCKKITDVCGRCGLSVGELLASFVGDLVDGTYSNGSNERMYAEQWLECCGFGEYEAPTLLQHLLCCGFEPEHYLNMFEQVDTIKSYIEDNKQNITNPSDKWKIGVSKKYNDDKTSYEWVPFYNSVDEYIASQKEELEDNKADLEDVLEDLTYMQAEWKPDKEPNMDEEIEHIKKWCEERKELLDTNEKAN